MFLYFHIALLICIIFRYRAPVETSLDLNGLPCVNKVNISTISIYNKSLR